MARWMKSWNVWVWEQALLLFLLGLAVGAQLTELHRGHLLSGRAGAAVLFAALMTVAGQKVRSIADRQAEADQFAGVVGVQIDCHRAQARWGFVAQALGLFTSIALAATAWHILIALYVGLYSVGWRRFYRAHVRAWRRS